MKFGSVDNPEKHDLTLPEDHPDTKKVLSQSQNGKPDIYVGCAKWNKSELKGFYPRGTKDELTYYSTQFNSIELNATHYRNFPEDTINDWYEKTPDDFRFFPKVYRLISHLKWLNEIEEPVQEYLDSVVHFRDKLGTIFLQVRDNFAPKFFDRVESFVELWPKDIPLAMEFRHPDWYNDKKVADDLYQLLTENNITSVLVDTAAYRELLHMRLTNDEAFIRYVGANDASDYDRLDEWVDRLKEWQDQGIQKIDFFVHQNEEKASPRLAAHFIKGLNEKLGSDLKIPELPDGNQQKLF
ncbi:DUF72 domain-containing protein [Rhodohalobacter sp. 614A]|uniref:DUF72 domain-containing protein n=1 Tax=Rhodohalobacter sp. 614A TaxID=2908649 RepID=UPI001F44BE00|nr:DUF72 domain-containing protein [Rhodohalobacter sp. 614A]